MWRVDRLHAYFKEWSSGPVEQILLFDDVRRQCGDHVAECGGLQLPELLTEHDVC